MKFMMLIAGLFMSVSVFAANNTPRVMQMIQGNVIAQATLSQAKDYAGVTQCNYQTQSQEVAGYDPGTVVDYTVNYTCTGVANDQGVINQATFSVSGRMFDI